MARPILWPAAARLDPAPAPGGPLTALDVDGFAAGFGPDFSRLAGFRVSATPLPNAPQAPRVSLARLKLGQPAAGIDLLIDAAGAAILLDRLFGARSGETAPELPLLPPSSASWLSLCRLISASAARALAAAGLAASGSPALPSRAMPADRGDTGPALHLQVDSNIFHLVLSDPQAHAAAAPPPPADPDDWRRRARARALDLQLPVTLRLPDRRMEVGDVAALQPGDVLPLDSPHAVDLMVAGRRLGRARLQEGGRE
jgi:flagellar motor switch/type III secretory pathway protein FliN